MIEWQTRAVLWAIENKPTAVEFMMTRPLDTRPMEEIRPGVKVSQVELVRMLAEASPKTLLVIRAYPDDPAHQDLVGLAIQPADTPRGYDWYDPEILKAKEFIVRRVGYEIDHEGGYLTANLGLEASTWGKDGLERRQPQINNGGSFIKLNHLASKGYKSLKVDCETYQ